MRTYCYIVSTWLCTLLLFPLVTHAQRNPAGKFSRAAMTLQPRGTVQEPSAVLRADDEIPTKTVIDQHFDLWTAGTNATPDGTMLGGSTVNYALPEDMMGANRPRYLKKT